MSGGLITNSGKKIMLHRTYTTKNSLSSTLYLEPSVFKVGMGTGDTTVVMTDLVHAVPLAGTETIDDCDTADWTDGAGAVSDLNTTTFKEGSASLGIAKTGTGSATIEVHKTTPSLSISGKELSIWAYVKDTTGLASLSTTGCLTIKYGSDNANFYYWTKNNSDLKVGWNLFGDLTTSTASTSGTPLIAACDYTEVQLKASAATTTWGTGDVSIDDIKLVSSDDYIRDFETGYPVLNYTTLMANFRLRVPTTSANGYAITEVGIFNEDGTPLMESRDLHNALSKTDQIEIIYDIKTELL